MGYLKPTYWVFWLALVLSTGVWAAYPENPVNGQIVRAESVTQVWNRSSHQWEAPETFWLSYAEQGSGKFWGRGSNYPTYNDVNEHDTLLIEVESGPCLMYFFHGRWRRAQDVQRWDPVFNDILGCPRVFD